MHTPLSSTRPADKPTASYLCHLRAVAGRQDHRSARTETLQLHAINAEQAAKLAHRSSGMAVVEVERIDG